VVTVVEEWVEWTECTIADFSRSVGRILGGILRAIVRAITAIVEGIASILLAIAATIAAVVGAVIDLINNVFSRRFTIFQSHTGRPIPSVPRLTAHAFSVAHVEPAGQPAATFGYNDSGSRYEFRIERGVVQLRRDDGEWSVLAPPNKNEAWAISYDQTRRGVESYAPPFDMVAANGGRVFVKEAGRDNFYFGIVDEMFTYVRPDRDGAEFAITIPSTYFKLDPEWGIANNGRDLTPALDGDFNNHPASLRFPVFKTLMGIKDGLAKPFPFLPFDFMVVRVRPGYWHLIDTRPPVNGGALPAGRVGYSQVAYRRRNLIGGNREIVNKQAVDFTQVLDIAVGYCHFYEPYLAIFGGELQPLFVRQNINDPFGIEERLFYHTYRVFNGPVDDGDGFIDGTCNYYLLVQLKDDVALANGDYRDAFAILWADEQTYFTQRWRLLGVEDFLGENDKVGSSNFALVAELHRNPQPFAFKRDDFWCPLHAGHITPTSRMVVSRQVIVVNGFDPQRKKERLYSINFSYATSDRTWRWRKMPSDTETETDPSEELLGRQVDPRSLRLREDTTLVLSGSGIFAGETIKGYWHQRYLPPDCTLPGEASGAMPVDSFGHPWSFFSERAFQKADRFSHFGVYETVDARCQCYQVELLRTKQPAGDEDTRWSEANDLLATWALTLNWQRLNACLTLADGELLPFLETTTDPGLFHVKLFGPPSLHNPGTWLKLAFRPGLGWIAMFWDKKDDDLSEFSDWRWLTFQLRSEEDVQDVRFTNYRRILRPPPIEAALVTIRRDETSVGEITVSFIPSPGCDIAVDVWRIKIGGFPLRSDTPLIFFDVVREGNFHVNIDTGAHEFVWQANERERECVEQFCSPKGRRECGTSIWFVNVVGQVATAGLTEFVSVAQPGVSISTS